MLPHHGAPLTPRHVARQGPPKPVFLAQLSLTAISRKIITPRSHTYGTSYLQNIYFNTCQGLLGMQAAAAGFSSQKTAGRAGGRAGRRTGGWGGGSPPLALRGGGLAVPVSPAAPAREQLLNSCLLCAVSAGGQRVETTSGISPSLVKCRALVEQVRGGRRRLKKQREGTPVTETRPGPGEG